MKIMHVWIVGVPVIKNLNFCCVFDLLLQDKGKCTYYGTTAGQCQIFVKGLAPRQKSTPSKNLIFFQKKFKKKKFDLPGSPIAVRWIGHFGAPCGLKST